MNRRRGTFRSWHLISFLFGLLWPGMLYVLTQTFVLQVTGSAADAGLIMAMIGLGALATPIFGRLADRFRAHRPLQLLALVLVLVGILIMAFAQDELFFTLAAILVGIGLAPVATLNTVFVVAAGLEPAEEAAAMASLQRMFFGGSILGGFLIAGLLQLQERGHVSYTGLFLINAVIVAATIVLAYATTREPARIVADVAARRAMEQVEQTTGQGQSLGAILRSPFGLTLLVVFLNQVGWMGMNGQYVNFLEGAFGIDRSITASVTSIAMLLSLPVIGMVGRWMGRVGPGPVLSVGTAARVIGSGALIVLGWTIGGAGTAIALPLLIWAGLRLVNPFTELSHPVLAARTSTGGAAQAQAATIAVFALALAIGNIIAGQVAERFGWGAVPWQTVFFTGLAFLVVTFWLRPLLPEGAGAVAPGDVLVERELEP